MRRCAELLVLGTFMSVESAEPSGSTPNVRPRPPRPTRRALGPRAWLSVDPSPSPRPFGVVGTSRYPGWVSMSVIPLFVVLL